MCPLKKIGIEKPIYKIGDQFKYYKSREIYTIKKITMMDEPEYEMSSYNPIKQATQNEGFYKQSHIQRLLDEKIWRRYDIQE